MTHEWQSLQTEKEQSNFVVTRQLPQKGLGTEAVPTNDNSDRCKRNIRGQRGTRNHTK